MTQSDTDNEPIRKQRKRIGPLKTGQDVVRYLARCIKRTERGEGGSNENYKLAMMASMLLKGIEISTLEDRISQLEVALKAKEMGR